MKGAYSFLALPKSLIQSIGCFPVIMLGLKFAAGLTKCPLKNLPMSVLVFVSQMIDIIHQTDNTEPTVAQKTVLMF
jgi:hypothetical protein